MAVGLTVPDAIPVELPGSQPLESLTGGSSQTGPKLAEVVQDLIIAQRATISDLTDRTAALEAAVAVTRWRTITEGSQSGGTAVQLNVPAGFKMLRLHTWGDVASGPEDILLRVNNDTGGSNHIWGLNIRAADGTTTSYSHSGAGTTAWRIGRWSTVESNNSLVHVFPTDGSANPSYLASAHRDSTTAAGHQDQRGYGKYLGDVVVSRLDLDILGSIEFATVNWVLEGFLA